MSFAPYVVSHNEAARIRVPRRQDHAKIARMEHGLHAAPDSQTTSERNLSERNFAGPVAIINGFGRSLGDSIIGMQALTIALKQGTIPDVPTLFRLPGLGQSIVDIYTTGADLCRLGEYPWNLAKRSDAFDVGPGFRTVIDIRGFVYEPQFQCRSMIDFFLQKLGIDAETITPADKRNTWIKPRLMPVRPPFAQEPYVLVCPRSSMPIRSMPDAFYQPLLDRLAAAGVRVVTQGAPLSGAIAAPEARSLAELAGYICHAKAVISCDTAMIHLADAFDTPCLAFFVLHEPDWRVRDYPFCRSIQFSRHRLPPGLEFARGDADVAEAHRVWTADSRLFQAAIEKAIAVSRS